MGTSGTYFEAYYDPARRRSSDVRLVYQNFARIRGAQAPPDLAPQCSLPELVGLSRAPNSGWGTSSRPPIRDPRACMRIPDARGHGCVHARSWSTSIFHTMRYPEGFVSIGCETPPPSPSPSAAAPAVCLLRPEQLRMRCSCQYVFGSDEEPAGARLQCA